MIRIRFSHLCVHVQKFKRILDNAKNGVLLVSWGGNVMSSSIPLHTQQEMIKGFAKLPLQVIWKWENASMQDIVPKNVLVSSWVPQRDILCKIFYLALSQYIACNLYLLINTFLFNSKAIQI